MRGRLAAAASALLAAGALAGCGGSDGSAPAPSQETPAAVVAGPTQAGLRYREELREQLENGTYGDCDCNGAERAKERVADGRAKPPPPDGVVLLP